MLGQPFPRETEMPIVKHVMGGAVSFRIDGRTVIAGRGFVGEVPQRILDKYKRQGRFQIVDEPFPRVTADVKRDEAITRQPEPAKIPQLGRYLARHRSRGQWAVTETESGKVVSELMPRGEAETKAKEMNGETA